MCDMFWVVEDLIGLIKRVNYGTVTSSPIR